MGRVFIEEAMDATGINRTNLVGVCTHLVRTKQASSAADALRRLEAGEFNKLDLEEQMIRSYQIEVVSQDDEDNEDKPKNIDIGSNPDFLKKLNGWNKYLADKCTQNELMDVRRINYPKNLKDIKEKYGKE